MSSSTLSDVEYYQQQNQSSQTAITAFLAKLWALVNDPSCDDLIAWDASGSSFHVYDQSRFAREILPRYFKHNNFASFIRQLNMYGFRKISTIEHGSLKNERDDIEFAHPSFIRGHDTLLESIKRRAPDNQPKHHLPQTKIEPPSSLSPTTSVTSPTSAALVSTTSMDTKSTRSVEYTQLLDDVRNLKNKQTSLTDKLLHMQDENQTLWHEVGILKQKHSKQQQIVSKLMEFLLHILTNSTSTHRPSVEQASTSQSQPHAPQHHPIINTSMPTNSLKRKPAALMLGEEPKKRPNLQPTSSSSQQRPQQHNILSQSLNLGRQPGIIINELTDNDTGGWLHTTDTSPLVDLVPSPPPPVSSTTQHLDDNTYQQQGQNNFEWTVPTDDLHNPLNFPPQNKSITNGTNSTETNSYLTDFFLNTDNNPGTKTNLVGQLDQTNLPGINTSLTDTLPLLKEEQIDFPNAFHPDSLKPSETVTFSLDDVTGDVHHIQTSLDNIRELMFDNLPDGTTIEDLFCDDHALLSPMLTTNNPTTNILTDNTQQTKLNNHFIYSNPSSNDMNNSTSQCKQIILHKNENSLKTPQLDVNNQLLEQLINETAKVEEQRHTINQLEREKINLEGKIHRLEQQQQQSNQRK